MSKRLTLRGSICEGCRSMLYNVLAAGRVGGYDVAIDWWDHEDGSKSWRGPKVQKEVQRIHRLLVDYLGKIERGEV